MPFKYGAKKKNQYKYMPVYMYIYIYFCFHVRGFHLRVLFLLKMFAVLSLYLSFVKLKAIKMNYPVPRKI